VETRSLQAVLLVSAVFHGIFKFCGSYKCLKGVVTSSLCLKYDELTNAVIGICIIIRLCMV